MNQIKIGGLLKELRKNKGLTQEQLAEEFNVSRRTVSRWETGSNLPDLDLLILLADFYEIGLRELLDGEMNTEEKKQENQEVEEAVLKAAEYSNEVKLKLTRRMHWLFVAGVVLGILYLFLVKTGKAETFLGGLSFGVMLGLVLLGAFFTSKYAARFNAFNLRLQDHKRD